MVHAGDLLPDEYKPTKQPEPEKIVCGPRPSWPLWQHDRAVVPARGEPGSFGYVVGQARRVAVRLSCPPHTPVLALTTGYVALVIDVRQYWVNELGAIDLPQQAMVLQVADSCVVYGGVRFGGVRKIGASIPVGGVLGFVDGAGELELQFWASAQVVEQWYSKPDPFSRVIWPVAEPAPAGLLDPTKLLTYVRATGRFGVGVDPASLSDAEWDLTQRKLERGQTQWFISLDRNLRLANARWDKTRAAQRAVEKVERARRREERDRLALQEERRLSARCRRDAKKVQAAREEMLRYLVSNEGGLRRIDYTLWRHEQLRDLVLPRERQAAPRPEDCLCACQPAAKTLEEARKLDRESQQAMRHRRKQRAARNGELRERRRRTRRREMEEVFAYYWRSGEAVTSVGEDGEELAGLPTVPPDEYPVDHRGEPGLDNDWK